jgi:flagellar basal-body rod protein FlgB
VAPVKIVTKQSVIVQAAILSHAGSRLGTPVAMNPAGIHRVLDVMKIQALAQHVQTLRIRELRNEVLTSNIANADTPNYKARDIDFSAALRGAEAGQLQGQLAMAKTSASHSDPVGVSRYGTSVLYRTPTQPSLDGNTVETDVEQAAFAENAIQYRAALTFLNGQIRTLNLAIKGSE